MNFKKSMLKAAALFAGSVLFAVTAMAEVNPKPFTVPEISSWKGVEGHFVPTPANIGGTVFTGDDLRQIEGGIASCTRSRHFPLQNAGDFNSRITNLKVSNF